MQFLRHFKLPEILALILYLNLFVESSLTREIRVMASQMKPFVFYDKNTLKGLDIDIIENFAKKFKLKVKYITKNKSLNEAFSTQDGFDRFKQSIRNV